eukprot:2805780-Prymnesium_polylepis.1
MHPGNTHTAHRPPEAPATLGGRRTHPPRAGRNPPSPHVHCDQIPLALPKPRPRGAPTLLDPAARDGPRPTRHRLTRDHLLRLAAHARAVHR